jgi:hypothetical protein
MSIIHTDNADANSLLVTTQLQTKLVHQDIQVHDNQGMEKCWV